MFHNTLVDVHVVWQERRQNMRLPPEVNRVLYVRNLPFKITPEEIYDIFGKYGTIFQIRIGDKPDTRGTAFVIYDDIYDAKNAVDHLSGFNVCGRYLIVLYYQQGRMEKRMDTKAKQQELDALKAKYNLSKEDTEGK
jgi:pre-mRNA branch site protein p14